VNHIGLFEGIGGFSLAARWMGWETIAWCEINPFCQTVLKHHFKEATPHEDITKTDFTIYRGKCDILTGGFPCQPYSLAGKRLGKEDERHLWPEMLRAIREIQPRWVVGENVFGLVNWNDGLVFHEVQTDLEAEGYEVQPFILPACAVNAPHRRDRVWFVAYSKGKQNKRRGQGGLYPKFAWVNAERNATNTSSIRRNNWGNNWQERYVQKHIGITPKNKSEWNGRQFGLGQVSAVFTDTATAGLEGGARSVKGWNNTGFAGNNKQNSWRNFPTKSPVCSRNDGLSYGLDGITFPKWRAESIKAYGNAIVPQVALQIFKAIEAYENKL